MTLPTVNMLELRKLMDWVRTQASLPMSDSQWFQGWFKATGLDLWPPRDCETAYCACGYVNSLHEEEADDWEAACRHLGITAWEAWGSDDDSFWISDEEPQHHWGLFRATNDLAEMEHVAALIAKRAGEEL